MNRAAKETVADELAALSIRKLNREMRASIAAMDDPLRAIEIEAQLRRDLAEDVRRSGLKPFVVGGENG